MWTMHATHRRGKLLTDRGQIIYPAHRERFEAAETRVKELADVADMFLGMGQLRTDTTRDMLGRAVRLDLNRIDSWHPGYVRALSKHTSWDFEVPVNELWAYWSARLFLETCAKWGYGIVIEV
jgi:hypothetical protein